MNNKEIWVFAELTDITPSAAYYELAGKADEIAARKGWDVAAVAFGKNNTEAVEALKNTCDRVYIMEHEKLADYTLECYAAALTKLAEEYKPEMLIIAATGIGSELAPTVAAKLRTGLAAHCIDIKVDEARDRINCMVPAFGGKVVSEIYIPETRPMMASVRPGILDKADVNRVCTDVVQADASFLNYMEVREEFIELIPEKRTGIKIEEADVVVAAGRGVNEKAWAYINSVAEALEGAVAWSRNFIDTGIVDNESNMIGTSGKSIKPQLFIGAGISGASHFVCGMTKSKLIINVNNDEHANIFDYSDYGVVGDAAKFMSALKELL